jgi:hypothetical protein
MPASKVPEYAGEFRGRAPAPVRRLGRNLSTKVPHEARGRVVATTDTYIHISEKPFSSRNDGRACDSGNIGMPR